MALKCTNIGEFIQAVMAEVVMTDYHANKAFHALLSQRFKDLSNDTIVEKEYTGEMRTMDLSKHLENPLNGPNWSNEERHKAAEGLSRISGGG